MTDGSVHRHAEANDGWHIDLGAGGARSSIDLDGRTPAVGPPPASAARPARAEQAIELFRRGDPVTFHLGRGHYRRSEQSWDDAGAPEAAVSIGWRVTGLEVTVDVPRSDRTFAPAAATNPYDNEMPDVNGDGVQLYVRTERGDSGWMLVPEIGSSTVRARLLDGWTAPLAIRAAWTATPHGYRMTANLELSIPPLAIDVVVNEMPRGRERRRGQLVLSGARGDFVYLRGDRHDREHLVPLRVVDA
jgi:hypothetical protein